MEAKPFWVVWSERGRAPVVKHACMADAEAEAMRLALLHAGESFHVLALEGTCVASCIVWARVPEEMPF